MGLYPVFLDAGYGPEYFWELSFGEVSDLLESYARRKEHEQKKREAELKDQIMLLFNQALQIVWLVFGVHLLLYMIHTIVHVRWFYIMI